MKRAIHHFDLWVQDPILAVKEWTWLFTSCGWEVDFEEDTTASWKHPDGTYVFLERSPDIVIERHNRLRPGINHLALTVPDFETLEVMRDEASEHGWLELFADRYPYAGGDDHTALYLENSESFEVEVVVEA